MVDDFKAELNVLNEQGTTPLFHAVSAGRRTIAEFLVDRGKKNAISGALSQISDSLSACYL
mgnify:CR=1 FL=1